MYAQVKQAYYSHYYSIVRKTNYRCYEHPYTTVASRLVAWVHTRSQTIPSFNLPEDRLAAQTKLPTWTMNTGRDMARGAMPAVGVYQNGLQVLCSRTK